MTHWATSLIGKPWVYGGRGPDAFDCWGFVQHVQRIQYGVNLPEVIVPDSWPAVRKLLETHEEHRHWDKVPQPMDGDIVMMARNKVPAHVGVVIEANGSKGILHCFDPSGVVYQTFPALRTSGWGGLTFYRHAHAG